MKTRALILLLLLTALPGAAQEVLIVALNIPTDLCAGADTAASVNVSFGMADTHSVVIQTQRTTLGHSERIFLPDGVPCGDPPTCTYRSPVTFNSFTPGATITSANDIKYVRLNIEHSFIGDLKAIIHAIPAMASSDHPTVQLYDQSTYSHRCRWTVEGYESHERNIAYTFPQEQDSVEVQLTAYSVEGCSDTTSITLHIDRSSIYLPNAFTPTENGTITLIR